MIFKLDKDEIARGIKETGLTQEEFCIKNDIKIKDMQIALSRGEANAMNTAKIAKGMGLMPGEILKKKYAL